MSLADRLALGFEPGQRVTRLEHRRELGLGERLLQDTPDLGVPVRDGFAHHLQQQGVPGQCRHLRR